VPVGDKRPAERPSGPAVAPQHVGIHAREELVGEEGGLARGQAVERVGARCPRQASGRIAPGEQPAWHDAHLVARAEETEDEVVILGPAAVAGAHRGENVASVHEGGVYVRTFDEGIVKHTLRGVEDVQPYLVHAAPYYQRSER